MRASLSEFENAQRGRERALARSRNNLGESMNLRVGAMRASGLYEAALMMTWPRSSRILTAASPSEVKGVASQVQNFDERLWLRNFDDVASEFGLTSFRVGVRSDFDERLRLPL